jgi:hypothetical protein
MKLKFYLLPLLLFLFIDAGAQVCPISVNCAASESRCVATGAITVTVTGGSGNYNYQAIGPITTPVTSTNSITGLPPGYYSVVVKDLSAGCSKQVDSVLITGTYDDPRFQLTKTDASCAGNDGSVSVMNQQFGRSPFTYTIIAPSPSNVGATNTSGNFSGLVPGEYAIQLQDSCGGIQVRRITIENYSWWFDSVSVVRNGCDMADVFIKLEDNKGNVNTSGTSFAGFQYGYVFNSDTTWYASNSFSIFLGTKRNLILVVKDNCGNVHSTMWFLPNNVKPSLGSVSLTNLLCSSFTASVTGQNLTNPDYCLYDNLGNSLGCNATGIFNNLPYGDYCIEVTDACYDTTMIRCFTAVHTIPSVAPSVSISNTDCSSFTATITGQANLTNPNYCLYDVNDVQIECNATGIFNNVPYGSYCIKTHDGCIDTTITRCFTVARPVAVLTGYTISGSSCTSFTVTTSGTNLVNPYYCLYDSLGNIIACDSSGAFSGIANGHYCIRATSCGDTTNSLCFTTSGPIPSVAPGVTITERKCTAFSVSITGQTNLTNAQYCLYTSTDSLISCDSAGNFYNIPYGSYCIKVHDGCTDTIITRCFTELQPVPSVSGTIQQLSSTCTTVSFKVNGTNLVSPTYCLYDSVNTLVTCNATGTFNNYPYGTYCVVVDDGCVDTTFRVCATFAPVRGFTLSTTKSCTMGTAYIDIQFANNNAPYTIKIYHPNGSLIYTDVTSANPHRMSLPALPLGTQYKVVATDNCGNKDSVSITPDANIVTRSTVVRAKCPSATWLNGAGDILASYTSNYYGVTPKIIKKNGVSFVKSYSSVTANTFTFADLEPAAYIVEYTQTSCNGKVYDTITVPPYSYPTQGQSAIYQCDNSGFSLGADVQGGVSPYTFQIIGSMPATPSIITSVQGSPVFTINNGTTYSLIRLRSVDACGNATLSDVSVLPLQNISITATNLCFYQDITLSVDEIPNATYTWYRKTTPTDSVLLDSGLSYNLPFFVPEQTGQYICKVNINDGCITRLARFTLDGDCGEGVLPVALQLMGRRTGNSNQLFWNNPDERGILKYSMERKRMQETSYTGIGTVGVHTGGNYFFDDNDPGAGASQYRLKLIYASRVEYSNVVMLETGKNDIVIYPNPVKDLLHISLASGGSSSYKIELINASGQLVYHTELKNISSTVFTYTRNKSLKPGMYLLKITDYSTGSTEIRKLLFE